MAGRTRASAAAPAAVVLEATAAQISAAQTALSGHIRALLGEAAPGGAPNEVLMKELISLYDSVHDFGAYGLPYDYVKRFDDGSFFTSRRTTFNHLRNMYPTIRTKPNVSYFGSQLRCSDINFYLKASIAKNELENSFLTAAKAYYASLKGAPALEIKHSDVNDATFNIFRAAPGVANIVFSVDTQKRLNDVIERLHNTGVNRYFFVYDMEKVCDPAPHQNVNKDRLPLLIENVANPPRTYTAANGIIGVQSATLSGFRPDTKKATITISIGGEAGRPTEIEMNKGNAHLNNITALQRSLNRQFGEFNNTGSNIDVDPETGVQGNGFYPLLGGYSGAIANADLRTHIMNLRIKFSQKRLGDQLQVLGCKQRIQYLVGAAAYDVTNAVFVSIDKMAIAFAIVNGVNCIYSNADRLTFFKGDAPCGMAPVARRVVGGAIPRPLKQSGGNEDVARDFYERLTNDPLLSFKLFFYSILHRPGFLGWQSAFKTFVNRTLNDRIIFTESISDGDGLVLRNSGRVEYNNFGKFYPDSTVRKIEDEMTLTYLANLQKIDNAVTGIFYRIKNEGDTFKLAQGTHTNNRGSQDPVNVKEYGYYGLRYVLWYSTPDVDEYIRVGYQRGGNPTHEKVKQKILGMLAAYDLLILADPEQTAIWHDPYYTNPDGIMYHKPSYYELYGLFHTLLESKDANFAHAMTYLLLNPKKSAFVESIQRRLQTVYEYLSYPIMNIVKMLPSSLTAEEMAQCESLYEKAEATSNEYAIGLANSDSSKLFEYCITHDLTPLSFFNWFESLYGLPEPPVRQKAPVNLTALKKIVSNGTRKKATVQNISRGQLIPSTMPAIGVARRRRTRRHRR